MSEVKNPEPKAGEAPKPDAAKADLKKVGPKAPPKPQPKPIGYSLTQANLNEIVEMVNQLIPGKYAKQAFFNGLNANVTPIFPKVEEEDKETTKE